MVWKDQVVGKKCSDGIWKETFPPSFWTETIHFERHNHYCFIFLPTVSTLGLKSQTSFRKVPLEPYELIPFGETCFWWNEETMQRSGITPHLCPRLRLPRIWNSLFCWQTLWPLVSIGPQIFTMSNEEQAPDNSVLIPGFKFCDSKSLKYKLLYKPQQQQWPLGTLNEYRDRGRWYGTNTVFFLRTRSAKLKWRGIVRGGGGGAEMALNYVQWKRRTEESWAFPRPRSSLTGNTEMLVSKDKTKLWWKEDRKSGHCQEGKS